MAFEEVAIESLEFNPFKKISKEWMLVTAGDEKKSNTMTASWGGVGIMWGKNIATAYIRPQRYTKKFMDETGMYTFFPVRRLQKSIKRMWFGIGKRRRRQVERSRSSSICGRWNNCGRRGRSDLRM